MHTVEEFMLENTLTSTGQDKANSNAPIYFYATWLYLNK